MVQKPFGLSVLGGLRLVDCECKPVEPVIPLVHAPDDPGLDSGLDRDPVPETSTPPASDAWRRLRQLFR